MKRSLFLVVLAVISLGMVTFSYADEREMALRGVEAIQKGAILVDVRSPSEFAEGHLPGALNIPHKLIQDRIKEFGTDKNAAIVVYCRSGGRAEIAEQTLRAAGFHNVTNGGEYESLLEVIKK